MNVNIGDVDQFHESVGAELSIKKLLPDGLIGSTIDQLRIAPGSRCIHTGVTFNDQPIGKVSVGK